MTTATSPAQPEQLSSHLTFFHKFVFPAVWIGGFGLGTGFLVLRPPATEPSPLLFLGLLVVGSAFLYRWGVALKKVTATQGGLLVSNFRREVVVPYEAITAVYENKCSRPLGALSEVAFAQTLCRAIGARALVGAKSIDPYRWVLVTANGTPQDVDVDAFDRDELTLAGNRSSS